MDQTCWELACQQAQTVMGRVVASVTHEIKNKLAVLLEQGAFVGDLARKPAQGKSLEPEKIEKISGMLVQRVKETDAIIRRLNAFAHSSDKPWGCLEAHEALGLMVEMHRRLADMRMVKLLAESSEKSINIETRPLFLLAALFSCLEAAVEGAPRGGEVRAEVIEEEHRVRFAFRWEGEGKPDLSFAPEVLTAVEGRLGVLNPGQGFCLTVPARFRSGAPGEYS